MMLRVLFTASVILIFSAAGQAASIGELLGLSEELISDRSSSLLSGSLQNAQDGSITVTTGGGHGSSGGTCGVPSYSSCNSVPVCGGAQPVSRFGGCNSGNGLPLNLTININITINVNCAATQPQASRCGCF